jgi:hypothetical protein
MEMVTTTLKKGNIFTKKNMMALFAMPIYALFLDETLKYFRF